MVVRFVQSSDGKFVGSIGNGKRRVPTAREHVLPPSAIVRESWFVETAAETVEDNSIGK